MALARAVDAAIRLWILPSGLRDGCPATCVQTQVQRGQGSGQPLAAPLMHLVVAVVLRRPIDVVAIHLRSLFRAGLRNRTVRDSSLSR